MPIRIDHLYTVSGVWLMQATEVERLHVRQQRLLHECRRAAEIAEQNTHLAFSRGQEASKLLKNGQLFRCREELAEAHKRIEVLVRSCHNPFAWAGSYLGAC